MFQRSPTTTLPTSSNRWPTCLTRRHSTRSCSLSAWQPHRVRCRASRSGRLPPPGRASQQNPAGALDDSDARRFERYRTVGGRSGLEQLLAQSEDRNTEVPRRRSKGQPKFGSSGSAQQSLGLEETGHLREVLNIPAIVEFHASLSTPLTRGRT